MPLYEPLRTLIENVHYDPLKITLLEQLTSLLDYELQEKRHEINAWRARMSDICDQTEELGAMLQRYMDTVQERNEERSLLLQRIQNLELDLEDANRRKRS